MPDKEPLPESDEARGRTVEELRKDNDALRERVAKLEGRLDDLDSVVLDEDDEDDEGEELEPWEE